MSQKLKEEYRALKKPSTSEGVKERGKVGKDGIIESDSDDERVPKRKAQAAPPAEVPTKEAKQESKIGVKEEDGGRVTKTPKMTESKVETVTKRTPSKHKPSKA